MKLPLHIVKELPKGRRGLRLHIVDAYGEHVIGGFGYFYETKLRNLLALVNACKTPEIAIIVGAPLVEVREVE